MILSQLPEARIVRVTDLFSAKLREIEIA
jgi:hypothetical protein